MKKQLLAILMAGTMMGAATTANAVSTIGWTGVDFAPSSYFIYLGAVTALTGQDITTTDGWLGRIGLGYGQYDYDTLGVPGGNVDGEITNGDLMVGYRHFFGNGNITGLLGGEIQHHDQSPRDFANKVDGSEGGVKGQLELSVQPMNNVEFRAYGNYSTAFDSYWTSATVGYNFGSFTLGPEVRALGNEGFNQYRLGAVVSQIDIGFANLSLDGGYAHNNGRGDNGAYGGIGFARNF